MTSALIKKMSLSFLLILGLAFSSLMAGPPLAAEEPGSTAGAASDPDEGLLEAVAQAQPDLARVKAWLELGADVNGLDEKNRSVLLRAVRFSGDPKLVDLLLAEGADPNLADQAGGTSLMYATRAVSLPERKISGPDDDAETYEITSLSSEPNPDPTAFKALLKAGADPNAMNEWGETAVLWAATNPNLDFLRALAGRKKPRANFRATSDHDETALSLAAQYNSNPQAIDFLVKAGLKVKEEGMFGQTILHAAAGSNPNPEVIRALLKAGAPLNAEDELGGTPTFAAAGNPNLEIIRTLLELKGRLTQRDAQGRTPLMVAAGFNDNPEMIGFLLKNGSRIDERNNFGYTALHYAAEEQTKAPVLEALIAAGADLEAKDDQGRTPLLVAACYSMSPVAAVRALAEKGARLDQRDEDGKTALGCARDRDKPKLAALLKELGAGEPAQESAAETKP